MTDNDKRAPFVALAVLLLSAVGIIICRGLVLAIRDGTLWNP